MFCRFSLGIAQVCVLFLMSACTDTVLPCGPYIEAVYVATSQ